jgi:thioredoxin 1
MADHLTTEGMITLTDQTMPAAVRDQRRLLVVDFWAPACPPCRILARTLTDLAGELGDRVTFAEINADDSPRSTVAYRIMSTPTVLVFDRSALVDAFVGARPKTAVRQVLLRHLEHVGRGPAGLASVVVGRGR